MSTIEVLLFLGFVSLIPLAWFFATLEERIITWKARRGIYPYTDKPLECQESKGEV